MTIKTTKHLQRTSAMPDMYSLGEMSLAGAKLMASGVDHRFSVDVSKLAEGTQLIKYTCNRVRLVSVNENDVGESGASCNKIGITHGLNLRNQNGCQ